MDCAAAQSHRARGLTWSTPRGFVARGGGRCDWGPGIDGSYQGKTGPDMLNARLSQDDPHLWSGRALTDILDSQRLSRATGRRSAPHPANAGIMVISLVPMNANVARSSPAAPVVATLDIAAPAEPRGLSLTPGKFPYGSPCAFGQCWKLGWSEEETSRPGTAVPCGNLAAGLLPITGGDPTTTPVASAGWRKLFRAGLVTPGGSRCPLASMVPTPPPLQNAATSS
jgi:hypothetical protein